jgi:transglutaminase-like putative cysteine protease
MESVRPASPVWGTALVRLCCFLLLCLAWPAGAAAPTPERPFQVRPPASWVKPVPLTEEDTHPRGETGGVHYALAEYQTRVEGREVERYSHHARRVLSESGIQEVAEVTLSFDPTYEQLILHGVWLHRGGQRRDVLDPTAVKVIQQERELEQRIYNGTLSALIFVRDVRAGDVIEYAYTTTGANPIFDGRFLSSTGLAFGVPVGHWRYRLLWPLSRKLFIRARNTQLAPVMTEVGRLREMVWEQRQVPALQVDDSLPTWFDPWPWLQFSEFPDWATVARWAAPLYAPPAKLSPALEAEVKRLRAAHPTPSARLLGALRFVQDEVRYLGIELGPNSHRPHAPEEVLARRFGDCKDKTLLLITLLRELGIQARPALVHTDWRQGIETLHPSPGVFDHVIVQARLEGRDYWLDPTVSQERGPLRAWVPPPYGRALLVDAATTGLVEIPAPIFAEHTLEVEEAYVEGEEGTPSTLTVTTRMSGPTANDMRQQLATASLKNLEREYLNYYARNDPKIRSAAPLSVTDDPERNVLTVVERYALDDFWTDRRRDFYAADISRQLRKPRISQRTMPLGIGHPVHVKQRIQVDIREPIDIDFEKASITGPASQLDYRFTTENGGRRLLLEYTYRSLQDAVEPARFMEHLETLKRMDRVTGYQVTQALPRSGTGASGSGFTVFGVILGLMALSVGGLLMMMENGPRAFLREWRAKRRKRAFTRKFAPVEGDLPDQAIAVATVADLTERLLRLRCECGASRSAAGEFPKLEEIVLGDEPLVLAKWACSGCGRARHAYFSVSQGRAA